MRTLLRWAWSCFFSRATPVSRPYSSTFEMVVKRKPPVDISVWCQAMWDLTEAAKDDDLELCTLEADLREFRRNYSANYQEFQQLNRLESRLGYLRAEIEGRKPQPAYSRR